MCLLVNNFQIKWLPRAALVTESNVFFTVLPYFTDSLISITYAWPIYKVYCVFAARNLLTCCSLIYFVSAAQRWKRPNISDVTCHWFVDQQNCLISGSLCDQWVFVSRWSLRDLCWSYWSLLVLVGLVDLCCCVHWLMLLIFVDLLKSQR